MLHIAGQTAGTIGRNFFVDTHGWPGGCYRLKKSNFFQIIFFHGQRRAFQLVVFKTGHIQLKKIVIISFAVKRLK